MFAGIGQTNNSGASNQKTTSFIVPCQFKAIQYTANATYEALYHVYRFRLFKIRLRTADDIFIQKLFIDQFELPAFWYTEAWTK